jgi:hypothetical protein
VLTKNPEFRGEWGLAPQGKVFSTLDGLIIFNIRFFYKALGSKDLKPKPFFCWKVISFLASH